MPAFGLLMVKALFCLMIPDLHEMYAQSHWWILGMLLCGITYFFVGFIQRFLFGLIGENITYVMRQKLYRALLQKHMGWFDRRENAPGVLASVLAMDVQTINGASTQGAASLFESFFALAVGIAIGFAFSWRLALLGLVAAPFMIAGGYINSKF